MLKLKKIKDTRCLVSQRTGLCAPHTRTKKPSQLIISTSGMKKTKWEEKKVDQLIKEKQSMTAFKNLLFNYKNKRQKPLRVHT